MGVGCGLEALVRAGLLLLNLHWLLTETMKSSRVCYVTYIHNIHYSDST